MHNILKEQIEKIGPLADNLWEEIQTYAEISQVRKNEILVPYQSLNKYVFKVISGSFMCSQISESGTKKAVWFHFDDESDIMSSQDSYFNNEPTKYEFKALEDSEVFSIHKTHTDRWIETYEVFNRFYLKNIINDFIIVYEARSCLLTYTSTEFLLYIQKKFPTIFEKIPDRYIADFMGVTPEWYSKLRKKLRS